MTVAEVVEFETAPKFGCYVKGCAAPATCHAVEAEAARIAMEPCR